LSGTTTIPDFTQQSSNMARKRKISTVDEGAPDSVLEAVNALTARIKAAEDENKALASRVQSLEDTNAIRYLHHTYGYLSDKCHYPAVVDLFSSSPETSVHFLNGIWKGREGVARLYVTWFGNLFTKGTNKPPRGFLLDHLMMQDIITVDVGVKGEGRVAKGRFRCFLQAGSHRSVPVEERPDGPPEQFWEGGLYENEYVFEEGKWKILKLGYNMLWQAEYEKGWSGSECMKG